MKTTLSKSLVIAAILSTFFVFQITGCDKDESVPQPTNSSIEGLWIGTYTVDGQPGVGSQYYSLVIKPDGTIINDTKGSNVQHLNIGTWSLRGDSLLATTTCVYGLQSNLNVVEKHTAVFDKNTGSIKNGVWKNVPPLNGSGTFVLSKVK